MDDDDDDDDPTRCPYPTTETPPKSKPPPEPEPEPEDPPEEAASATRRRMSSTRSYICSVGRLTSYLYTAPCGVGRPPRVFVCPPPPVCVW